MIEEILLRIAIAESRGFKRIISDCELGGKTEIWFIDPSVPDKPLTQFHGVPKFEDDKGRVFMVGNIPAYTEELTAYVTLMHWPHTAKTSNNNKI